MKMTFGILAAAFLLMILTGGLALEGDKVYVLTLNYDSGNIKFVNVSINAGFAPSRNLQEGGDYKADVVAIGNKSLYSFRFSFPFILTTAGERQLYDKTSLLIPYFPNAKEIGIYDANETKKLSVEVLQFAIGECLGDKDCDDLDPCTADACLAAVRKCSNAPIVPCCGDGLCETGENCQLDCPTPSGFPLKEAMIVLLIAIVAVAILAMKKRI